MERLNFKVIVGSLSIILILVGGGGMVYCLPSLFSNSLKSLIGAGFSFLAGAVFVIGGLISLSIILSNKKNNEINVVIPSDKNWKVSILFGFLSFLFFCLSFIKEPPSSDYAPHLFSYNISFLFPVLFISLIFGIICLIAYFYIDSEKKKQYKLVYRITPILFIFPIIVKIGAFLIFIIW